MFNKIRMPQYLSGISTKMSNSFKEAAPRIGSSMSNYMKKAGPVASMGSFGLMGLGMGASLMRGVSSFSRSLKQGPTAHIGSVRKLGTTSYSLGADPFAGVKFARRRRTYTF